MNKIMFLLFSLGIAGFMLGCNEQNSNPRVNLSRGVGSDSLSDNIIVRPIGDMVSALLGEGLEVERIKTSNSNDGIMLVQIGVYNKSTKTRKFQYKVDWLDANGFSIDTKTSVWLPFSVAAKSRANISAIAPKADAVDFTINTRK